MKLHVKFIIIIAAMFCIRPVCLLAQTPPFYNDVQKLKKIDSTSYPAPNSILFTGSSSFVKWTSLKEDFPDYPVVNRAFGGSTFPDLIRYANQVIIPYKPKQIFIYCGDNDLASSDTVTPAILLNRFVTLFNMIRAKLPKTYIDFVSIKPSPSRERLMPNMVEANRQVKEFLADKPRTAFIDVYSKMLLDNGKPDPSLFVGDNLHMNAKGYAIWQKVLHPYLLK